jgi:hypothetical protein
LFGVWFFKQYRSHGYELLVFLRQRLQVAGRLAADLGAPGIIMPAGGNGFGWPAACHLKSDRAQLAGGLGSLDSLA